MKEIHSKEDTSKPENRVNLTLFHLLILDKLRNFIQNKLGLPLDSVISPSPNLAT
jgi:hypothetical protein